MRKLSSLDYTVRIKKTYTFEQSFKITFQNNSRWFLFYVNSCPIVSSASNKTIFCSRLGEHWLCLSRVWKMTCAELKEEGKLKPALWVRMRTPIQTIIYSFICLPGRSAGNWGLTSTLLYKVRIYNKMTVGYNKLLLEKSIYNGSVILRRQNKVTHELTMA